MKGTISNKPDIALSPGVYEADLLEVEAWRADKYQQEGTEVILNFVWELEDDNEEMVQNNDNFIRLTQGPDGMPTLNERSKLYNRLAALYGQKIDTESDNVEWEIVFPRQYNSVEGLLDLPHYNDRKDEQPVLVKSIIINDGDEEVELIGGTAQVNIIEKGQYFNVESATARARKKKSKKVRDIEPIAADEGTTALPV
ncbi:MAG: hypothetical protein AAF267_20590 [Deinococcota bacterium]